MSHHKACRLRREAAILLSDNSMPTLIGITGQIGAGKSTAAKVLAHMGAAVINADQIGREVVEKNSKLRLNLAKSFGNGILTSHGKLRRQRVAEIAFSSRKNKRKLDQLVHPFLLKEINRQIKRQSRSHKVIVIDAALLLDWGLDKITDKVLVIKSGTGQRLNRLKKRGINATDALARQKMQLPNQELQKHADKTIFNNSSKRKFQNKVKSWAEQFFNSN